MVKNKYTSQKHMWNELIERATFNDLPGSLSKVLSRLNKPNKQQKNNVISFSQQPLIARQIQFTIPPKSDKSSHRTVRRFRLPQPNSIRTEFLKALDPDNLAEL